MLKIGVIGCGKITEVRHAPEYQENPDCRLCAWFDALPERAQAMAGLYGGQVYDSVEALLASGVDAVSVCVANHAHAEIAVKALEAGCHVLCEKPMATTMADCQRMLDAAKANGKRLMIGHNQRFARAHVEARRMIQAGEVGRVLAFHTTFTHPGPESWTGSNNSWFFDRKRAAFGALADLGIHKTDLIHYLIGEPIVQVTAALGTVDKKYPDGSPIAVDDNAFCLFKTEGGAMGELHAGWTNYGQEDNSTHIYGTKGRLRLYDDPEYSLIWEPRGGEAVRLKLDEMTTNAKQTAGGRTSTGVIDAFVKGVVTGEKTIIDAEEVIKAMRVTFAAEQSAKEGRAVEIAHN